MKLPASIVFGAALSASAIMAGPAQTKTAAIAPSTGSDHKEVQTTLPGSEPIRMRAISIDRNWDTSMTHLRGDVEITVRVMQKDAERRLVIHADEAEVNEKSGEITPSGHVRITVEEPK